LKPLVVMAVYVMLVRRAGHAAPDFELGRKDVLCLRAVAARRQVVDAFRRRRAGQLTLLVRFFESGPMRASISAISRSSFR
jgi:hypothetical protein